jgi:hypothetical protein
VEISARVVGILRTLHTGQSNLCSANNPSDPNLRLDPLDGENLPQSPQTLKSVQQDDAEDVSDQVKPMIYFDTGDLVWRTLLMEEYDDGLCCRARIIKPMIYFDTGDLVGQTFLMEEDDDGLWCRPHIIEVLDNHEKNPVLKKFKCLVGEDKFEKILSYNEVMQHIEKDDDDGGLLEEQTDL